MAGLSVPTRTARCPSMPAALPARVNATGRVGELLLLLAGHPMLILCMSTWQRAG